MESCQTCKHWQPLFSGEHWGVRSVADAPAEVQAEVLAKLVQLRDEGEFGKADDWLSEKSGRAEGHSPDDSYLPGPDWPLWGQCALAGLDYKGHSLAKAMDGSLYMAELRTRYDFGCVQHAPEPKPAPPE